MLLLDLLKEDHSFWYAGDFDPEGLLIAQNLKERYKTAPHIRKPCWQLNQEGTLGFTNSIAKAPYLPYTEYIFNIIYKGDTPMTKTLKRLAGYYKPYKGLFFSDMFFAILGAGITLMGTPLLVRYITSTVVYLPSDKSTDMIVKLGIFMIVLVLIEAFCNFYIAYYGHIMGASIERDMRNEIFSHYQKLSFAFYDNQKVGHLLSRITADLFDISELLHHGQDLVILLFNL